jgi:hypothetical protein
VQASDAPAEIVIEPNQLTFQLKHIDGRMHDRSVKKTDAVSEASCVRVSWLLISRLILQLRKQIGDQMGIRPELLRFVFRGSPLADNKVAESTMGALTVCCLQTFAEQGIKDGDKVFLIMKLGPGG